MSIRDEMRTAVSERGTLRVYLVSVAVLGLALLVMWPRATMEAALRTGQASDTFEVVSVCFLLVLLYLGARFGAEDFAGSPGTQLRDYVTLTPISLATLTAGRLAAGTLHTIVLLLLGAPFLVASMAVGGAELPMVLEAMLVIGASSLVARTWGLLGLVLIPGRRGLRDALVFVAVMTTAVLTFFLTPAASPFHLLAGLTRSPDDSAWLGCLAASAAAVLALAVVSFGAMAGVRARARKKGTSG